MIILSFYDRIENRYKSINKKINDDIKNAIINYIKYSDSQMTSSCIQEKIKEKYNIQFSVNHISRILRDNNITYKFTPINYLLNYDMFVFCFDK